MTTIGARLPPCTPAHPLKFSTLWSLLWNEEGLPSIRSMQKPDQGNSKSSRGHYNRSKLQTRFRSLETSYVGRRVDISIGRRLRLGFPNINVRHAPSLATSERSRPVLADGNGLHTHVSIHSPKASEGETSPLAPTLNPLEAIFLQSLLDNLGGICAFSMTTPSSYERTDEYVRGSTRHIWGPGKHVCWGTHHRQAPIRLCGPPGAHKFELRSVDAAANPYLFLASIVAAAIEGADNQMALTASDSAALLGQNAKTVAVIPDELPHSLDEAFHCLEERGTMRKFFGKGFIQAYRGVIEVRSPVPGV